MLVHLVPQLSDNYSYVLVCEKTNTVAIVDCPDADSMVHFLQGKDLTPSLILNTHHHFDHTGGNEELLKKWPELKVYGAEVDAERIPMLTDVLNEGDTVLVGESQAKVLFTPGHTSGHISFWFEQDQALFCGDALFFGGCGRFFEGTPAENLTSFQKLRQLPDETKVYCGHEYTLSNLRFAVHIEPENQLLQETFEKVTSLREQNLPSIPSTLGLEKEINPFLRWDQQTPRKKALEAGASDEDASVVGMLREMKNNF